MNNAAHTFGRNMNIWMLLPPVPPYRRWIKTVFKSRNNKKTNLWVEAELKDSSKRAFSNQAKKKHENIWISDVIISTGKMVFGRDSLKSWRNGELELLLDPFRRENCERVGKTGVFHITPDHINVTVKSDMSSFWHRRVDYRSAVTWTSPLLLRRFMNIYRECGNKTPAYLDNCVQPWLDSQRGTNGQHHPPFVVENSLLRELY